MDPSGGSSRIYFDEVEIGNANKSLSTRSVRKYVKDCPIDFVNKITITGDETWQYDIVCYSDLIIKSGAYLNIKCKVSMPTDSKIIVERGGRLVIDGGTITKSCDGLWQGIEVWGADNLVVHPTRAQIISGTHPMTSTSHGVVYIKNGGTIEYARNGITTSKYDEYYNTAYYGGVILATDANFINNRRSVEFMQYNYNNMLGADDNVSEFKECLFEVNDDYPCTETFYSHISMWNVHGVDFLGNTYKDLRKVCTNSDTKAIYSIDATYKVANIPCPPAPDPCPMPLPIQSSFEGFIYPVFAANTTYLPRDIEINGNDFTDNYRSILLSGVKNSLVINNSFEVQDRSTLNCYGMYLESCENYHIENNFFTTFGSYINSSPYKAGIYVQNNSNAVTEIYRNNFEYLEAGVRSQGNNKKLQIKCNVFISVIRRHDIYVTSGELGNQGRCLNSGFSLKERVQSPAGNIFSHDCYGTEGDFKVFPELPSLIYKHHTPAAYVPQCYTTSLITLQDCNRYPDEGGYIACPSKLPGTGGGGEEFIIGGGGTAASMMSEVNAINEKIEELYELIAAEGYTTEEMASGDFVYEDDLAYVEGEKEILLKEAVDIYAQEGKTDSAIAVLSAEDASWGNERMVELFTIKADYEVALNALSEVNTDDIAGTDFVSLYEVVIFAAQEGRNILQLNKEELSALESFAGKQSPSGVAAENILEFAAGANYPEIFDVEMEDAELRFSASPSREITIYPNPATNELFIQVNSENIFEAYSFEMYFLTGTLLLSGNLQHQELHVLDLGSIPAGIYLIRIHSNGETKQIEKIVKE